MKLIICSILFGITGIFLPGCQERNVDQKQIQGNQKLKFTEIPGWTGIFQDTLPCKDCPGLITWLEIHPDGKYKRISTRTGVMDALANTSSTEGKWSFDAVNGLIKLDYQIEKDLPAFFSVGDSVLIACDQQGIALENGRWKLRRRSGGDGLQDKKQVHLN